mmetsp:Transcript_26162/g.67609  ORF Transcript_26162/g.67609 Transcript_26162/m.67609 type:complete len:216 (-) Transcript_26162:611-1258(-)
MAVWLVCLPGGPCPLPLAHRRECVARRVALCVLDKSSRQRGTCVRVTAAHVRTAHVVPSARRRASYVVQQRRGRRRSAALRSHEAAPRGQALQPARGAHAARLRQGAPRERPPRFRRAAFQLGHAAVRLVRRALLPGGPPAPRLESLLHPPDAQPVVARAVRGLHRVPAALLPDVASEAGLRAAADHGREPRFPALHAGLSHPARGAAPRQPDRA